MVDAVSTVSTQGAVLRPQSQPTASSAPATQAQAPGQDFVTSQIYIDNLQNVAILEYRSARTGEVVQQYPTQAQIQAFKRAEQAQSSQETQTRIAVAAQQHQTADTGGNAAPASVPAPAPAPKASSGGSAPAESSGGHSVLA